MSNPSAASVTPQDLHEVAPGVFYATRALPLFDAAIIGFLKTQANANPLRRARICAHPSPGADQHDMLIVSHRDTYVAPHRHRSKSESFHIVEGEAAVLLFDDDGARADCFSMGAVGSGRPFLYRMPALQYHSLSIDSEHLVFVESTKGPFRREDMENAPWAPDPLNLQAGRAFIARLRGGR
jgi:cupin fold WbuC family metalloprotein